MGSDPKWTCENCDFVSDSTPEAEEHAVDGCAKPSIVETDYDPGITPVRTRGGREAR